MTYRYVFTVTAGRSGQHSLSKLLAQYVPGCYAAFEEPQVNGVLPFPFRTLERAFRRRFVETNELLGRGQVLTAFERDDRAYLAAVAQRRLDRAQESMSRSNAAIYFDVSKFFARGLHAGFAELLPEFSLLHLVRDPIRNMRSFLNRGKRFALDNGSPASSMNELRLDPTDFSPGDFYLWAWCEMHLRFDRLVATSKISFHAELHTEDLVVPSRVAAVLAELHIDHRPLGTIQASNTNEGQGFGPTRLRRSDIELFESFYSRLPISIRPRIRYLASYDPWTANKACLSDNTR